MRERKALADSSGSVCLTRIVQLVDTIRLNFRDPTWSNVDVAIWNMIESHIGAVAANIPLMGPLITLLGKQFYFSATAPSTKRGKSDKQDPSVYVLGPHRGVEHGFKRMNDDGSADRTLVGMASPTIGGCVSELDEEMSNVDQLGRHGTRVKTELEQNYGGPMPPRGAVC